MNVFKLVREDHLACNGHCQTEVLGTEERQLHHRAAAMKPGPTLSESVAFVVTQKSSTSRLPNLILELRQVATSRILQDVLGMTARRPHTSRAGLGFTGWPSLQVSATTQSLLCRAAVCASITGPTANTRPRANYFGLTCAEA